MQFGQGLALNQMTPGATQNLLAPLLQQRMAKHQYKFWLQHPEPVRYGDARGGDGRQYGDGRVWWGNAGWAGGGLGLSGAPVSNVGGGLGSYAQGGSSFLVNMPPK
jgi:hypothetical protein